MSRKDMEDLAKDLGITPKQFAERLVRQLQEQGLVEKDVTILTPSLDEPKENQS